MTKLGNMIFCSPAAGRRCTISFIKTAADISENQIAQAALSEGMKIEYYAVPAEKLAFPDEPCANYAEAVSGVKVQREPFGIVYGMAAF